MRWLKLLLLLLNFQSVNALEHLPQKYLVTYGNPEASIKIKEYFSLVCPHCIALFRKDFKKIKEQWIDQGEIYWEFHPVPQELWTVQGMACLELLTSHEKRVFLESLIEEIDIEDPSLTSLMMIKAMDSFKKPLPRLEEKDFLSSTQAFQDAFTFIKQDDQIDAIPTVEINGKLFPKDIPDETFIRDQIQKCKK